MIGKQRDGGVWASLVRFLAVLAVLLVSAEAQANNAPMCDEDASSVSGPIPALPNDSGEIRARPGCGDDATLAFAAAPSNDRSATDSTIQTGKRALASAFAWPKLKGVALPVPRAERMTLPAGHRASIYRPPQA